MNRKQAKNHKKNVIHGKGSAPKTNRYGYKRVAFWFLGLVAIAITALITATFTNLGTVSSNFIADHLFSIGPPVRIYSAHATEYLDDIYTFENAFVLSDAELSQLNSLNSTGPSYETWFKSRGAVDTNSTRVEFVVEGNRYHKVRITDIHPIVSCHPPLKGTLFYKPLLGGEMSTELFVDLDNPRAAPGYMAVQDGARTSGKDYFGTHTVSLEQNEQNTFKVVASTEKHFCKFTLAMTVLDGDKTTIETITNNEQPFQVTALLSSNHSSVSFSAYQVVYSVGFDNPLWKRSGIDPNIGKQLGG